MKTQKNGIEKGLEDILKNKKQFSPQIKEYNNSNIIEQIKKIF